MRENEQLAIVTGASSGIGERFAYLLAQRGYNLIITARRIERLMKTVKNLEKKHGVKVFAVAKNLLQKETPLELYRECENIAKKENLTLSILINNAGMGQWNAFEDTPIERQLKGIQLNIIALTELTFYFIKTMKNHRRQSYIMNVSSLVSFLPAYNYAVYGAGKSYVRAFSQALFYELEQSNIHVHCFCPGGTVSEFMNAAGQEVTHFGKRGLMTAEKVAEIGLKDMFFKKKISIPGIGNKISYLLAAILPERINKYLLFKIMSRSVKSISF